MVIGGLQQKVFNLVLITILLIIAAYTAVILYQTNTITTLVGETNEKQQESMEEISSSTMNTVITTSLGSSTELEAYIADDIFSDLASEVGMLSDYARRLYLTRGDYAAQAVARPDAANDGKVSVQLMTEEGVSIDDAAVAANLGLVGNMTDMMQTVFRTSRVNSCFVATTDGTILIADDRAAAKFDDDGNLLTLPVRERPWYVGAVEKGDLYFTDVERDAFTDQIGIVCAKPVYVRGELVAVVGADLFLNELADAVISMSSQGGEAGESGFLCIVNQNGHIIFSPKESGVFQVAPVDSAADLREGDDKELAKFVSDALSKPTGVQIVHVGDTAYYMVGEPLNTVGWAMMSIVSVEATQAPTKLMLDQYNAINEGAVEGLSKSISGGLKWIIALVVLILILATTAAYLVTKRMVKPLNTMTKRVTSIGGKDLQFFMEDDYRTGDEIEVLAEAFAKLSEKTLQYVEQVAQVTAEKERIGAELEMATSIQASQLPHLFPAFPDRKDFDVYASMTPAKEVGGDFYDFFLVDSDHIGLVMADVSGKGVPAALFMMISKILIRNRVQNGESPSIALPNVNKQLIEGNEADLFVTVWLAVIDLRTGKGVAANAGHEHPALRRANGEYELVTYPHSMAVAVLDGLPFEEHEFEMHPGDSLFVYTDGVAEAMNASEELFGTDRMLTALNKNPDADPEDVLKNVKEGIDEFVGDAEQFDDITMMCFRYHGRE